MGTNRDPDYLYEIARRYAKADGQRLEAERRALEAQGPMVTPRLDAMVEEATAPKRFRGGRALIAACLIAALLLPRIVAVVQNLNLVENAPGSAGEGAAPEGAESGAPAPPEAAPGMHYIPLGANLPDSFHITSVEQDLERTVYYIADRYEDDVVAMLRYADLEPTYRETMERVVIGGSAVYVHSDPDYKMMAFEKDGIAYELSCRHDINTLVRVAESIL